MSYGGLSAPAETVLHASKYSAPAETVLHASGYSVPAETVLHASKYSVPAETVLHASKYSVPAETVLHARDTVRLQRLFYMPALLVCRRSCRSITEELLNLIISRRKT